MSPRLLYFAAVALLIIVPVSCLTREDKAAAPSTVVVSRDKEQKEKEKAEIDAWNYCFSFVSAKKYQSLEWCVNIADNLMIMCHRYDLDPYLMTRVLFMESWGNMWAISYKRDAVGKRVLDKWGNPIPIAYGLMQLHLEANWEELLKCENGELRGRVWDVKSARDYVFVPRFNIEACCRVYRRYLDQTRDHETALVFYFAGPYSKEAVDWVKRGKRAYYAEAILAPKTFELNAMLYHEWNFIQRKTWQPAIPVQATNLPVPVNAAHTARR